MTDVFSKKKRSQVMATIRSSGNKATELTLVAIFRRFHIKGWRRKQKVFGSPDFVFPKAKLVVFVDGCFWHGCRWHCRMPKSRSDYWAPKIIRNKSRDLKVNRFLRKRGWTVARIWEHDLHDPAKVVRRMQAILDRCA